MKESANLRLNNSRNEEDFTTKRGRMNNTPLPACPKIVKWIFVFFNVLFAILGIVLIALGSWLVATGNEFVARAGGIENLPAVVSGTALGGGALIIICGLITFILAALGVFGGICQARPLLVIFAVGLIIIVVIEFIGAVVVFLAFGPLDIASSVTNRMRESLDLYREPAENEGANILVNGIQTGFSCCGFNSSGDWLPTTFFNLTSRLPDSCCTGAPSMRCFINSTEIHMDGCTSAVVAAVSNNRFVAVAVGVVAILILLVEICGIVIACGLCCCIRSAKLTLV